MKKLGIFVLAAVMVLGLAIGAQATTIGTPWAPDTGNASELNLYTIINGWTGLSLTNAQLEGASLLTVLPSGAYTLINYATFSAYSQTLAVPSGNLEVTPPDFVNLAVNVPFSEGAAFGFTDIANAGAITLKTDGTGDADRLQGLIIPLAQFGAAGYIVAFEDGNGGPKIGDVFVGDQDYNDMVGYVVPVPPSALLMGSGLLGLGLVGWRRRLFGQA